MKTILCGSCRRKTVKGRIKTVNNKGELRTEKNLFCSANQQSLNNVIPIICSHYKEVYKQVLN